MKVLFCFTLTALFVTTVVLTSGCSNSECTPGDTMPAWVAKLGIPSVEGAEVCRASDKLVRLIHHDRDAPELMTAYANKLKQSGWTASEKQSKEPGYESYQKGSYEVMIHAKRCDSPSLSEYFGRCTIVDIYDDSK